MKKGKVMSYLILVPHPGLVFRRVKNKKNKKKNIRKRSDYICASVRKKTYLVRRTYVFVVTVRTQDQSQTDNTSSLCFRTPR